MKITPRRVARLRDEMRQWLRSHYGIHATYAQNEIDRGREDLGFDGVEDALVAYTMFGGDLMPNIAESLDVSVSLQEVNEIIGAASTGIVDAADLLFDD